MTDYVIGPGVAQAIQAANDEPRSDEMYVILDAGRKISQTFGRDAIYWWYEEDNRTQRSSFR